MAALLAACAAGDEVADTDGVSPAFEASDVGEEERGSPAIDTDVDALEAAEEAVPVDAEAAVAGPTQLVDIGREIIFTATIEVEVEDVGAARQQAQEIVERLGGILFRQRISTEGVPATTMTFRLPPAEFDEAVARLGEVGFLRDWP